MSSYNKLQKFAENETFDCLFQPEMSEVFRTDYKFKNRWHSEVFGNDNPIVLELGCGKGEYTIALAQRNPDKNYIGIDIKGARLWKGAKYVTVNGLKNVRFIRTKIDFIEWIFGEGEISEIWITFPDPQLTRPRKRLTSSLFLERYSKLLVPNGLIHLKTDSRFLHEYTKALVVQNGLALHCSSSDIYGASGSEAVSGDKAADGGGTIPEEILSVKTFYEQFYIKMGLKITYLCFSLLPPFLGDASATCSPSLKEPVWDVEHWREVEEQGRSHQRIQ